MTDKILILPVINPTPTFGDPWHPTAPKVEVLKLPLYLAKL